MEGRKDEMQDGRGKEGVSGRSYNHLNHAEVVSDLLYPKA